MQHVLLGVLFSGKLTLPEALKQSLQMLSGTAAL